MAFVIDMDKNYEQAPNLYALDSTYSLSAILVYSDLQWTRRYHSAGSFSIVLVGDYNRDWKYIYSPERKELGIISQINLSIKNGVKAITISGYFAEEELNKMIVYPKPTHFYGDGLSASIVQASGTPTWINYADTADEVAMAFFNGFKSVTFTNYDIGGDTQETHTMALDIADGSIDEDHGTYKASNHNRNGELLGAKIYDILKESGASYEVEFDYSQGTKAFNIIHGRDLTGDVFDADVNPVCFSTLNGTVSSVSLVESNTDTKDAVVSTNSSDEENIVLVNAQSNSIGRFIRNDIQQTRSDYWDESTSDKASKDLLYKQAVMRDARSLLLDRGDVLNIDFDTIDGSYEYMKDFDLGDLVAIEVPEIGLSANARIISCYEKVSKGVWSITLEFGTPLLRKRG